MIRVDYINNTSELMCVGGSPICKVPTGTHPADHPENPGALWYSEGCDHLKTVSVLQ
jgi:hypothetical protein